MRAIFRGCLVVAAILAVSCSARKPTPAPVAEPWPNAAARPAAAPATPPAEAAKATAAEAAAAGPRERTVRSFNAAFNAQDVAAMVALVTADVQWLSVKGAAAKLETKTKEELRRSMLSYFRTCPTCRSRLERVVPAKSRVGVLEVATWTTPSGPREAQGFVVYEFSGALISRVYYFPVED